MLFKKRKFLHSLGETPQEKEKHALISSYLDAVFANLCDRKARKFSVSDYRYIFALVALLRLFLRHKRTGSGMISFGRFSLRTVSKVLEINLSQRKS